MFPVSVSTSSIFDNNADAQKLICVARDITKGKRLEAESRAISRIIHGAASTTNLEEFFHLVHRSIKKIVYAENFFVALFDPETEIVDEPQFEVVACSQGDDAVRCAKEAASSGHPFDVVILDVRMPPGIDGVEAGSAIRKLDPNIEIVFVTGFSDVPREELERRVPPPMKLHYFNKPISFMRLAEDVAQMVRSH